MIVTDIRNCQALMTDIHNAFADRLLQVLADRKKHPWGQALGISNAVITTMFRGQIPTFEALSAIQRCENVSLDWLLRGHGAPYLVHREPSDACAAAYLRRRVADEPAQRVHLLADGVRLAIVLDRPAGYTIRDRAVEYRDVEVIAEPCGGATAAALADLLGDIPGPAHLVDVPPVELDAVIAGERGTYALFGDDARRGLLAEVTPVATRTELWEYLEARGFSQRAVAEPSERYGAREEVLAIEEAVLLASYRRMPADDRARLLRIADALAGADDSRTDNTGGNPC
jgi:hypothetical protein